MKATERKIWIRAVVRHSAIEKQIPHAINQRSGRMKLLTNSTGHSVDVGDFNLMRLANASYNFPHTIMLNLIHRYFGLVHWTNHRRPTNKPRPTLPGIGLELAIFGAYMILGVGHLVLFIRG